MNYFIQEELPNPASKKMAAGKARNDVEQILTAMNFAKIEVERVVPIENNRNLFKKLYEHLQARNSWKAATAQLQSGDCLLIQYPCQQHSVFLSRVFKKITEKGVQLIFLIHDLEIFRVIGTGEKGDSLSARIRIRMEEVSELKAASKIIVHNDGMKGKLVSFGINLDQMISLDIFDYLIDADDPNKFIGQRIGKDLPVIVAGNLYHHKAGYVYALDGIYRFYLYGLGYDGVTTDEVSYKGAFDPEELPYVLEGSFGLVWDGETTGTCAGVRGEYLRINNPHKASLYLAVGFPVVIWRDAALADFIQENRCGFLIDSIEEIPTILSSMKEEEYQELLMGACKIGKKLRQGYYLSTAIQKCLEPDKA